MALQYNLERPLWVLLDGLEQDKLAFVMVPQRRTFFVISVDGDDFIVTKGFGSPGSPGGDYEGFDRNYVLEKWGHVRFFDIIENTTGSEVGSCISEYERSKILSLAKGRSLI